MRLCNLDEIKICVDRQYENCHGYSLNKKTIYREAILSVKSILHSAKIIDAVPVVRCAQCNHFKRNLENDTYCSSVNGLTDPQEDDFCSYGEKRGSEHE